MSVRVNFADINLQRMRERSMQSGTGFFRIRRLRVARKPPVLPGNPKTLTPG